MLSLLVLVFYLLMMLFYILASFFIAYHLIKFSIASEIKIIMLLLFVSVSAGLIFSNVVIFFSIDWNNLLSQLTL